MSKKIGITLAVILVIVLGGWYFIGSSNKYQTDDNSNQQVQNLGNQNSTQVETETSSSTDTSDTGIDQDVKVLDSHLQALGTDSSNANQDVSATPAL